MGEGGTLWWLLCRAWLIMDNSSRQNNIGRRRMMRPPRARDILSTSPYSSFQDTLLDRDIAKTGPVNVRNPTHTRHVICLPNLRNG
ncbi:hypothetical protein DFJ77DRAFT_454285 [Powellomyces hirtus]|nr:hypothetical protein DFJ77DRAFT_454285 [Powellomyces hirtus]